MNIKKHISTIIISVLTFFIFFITRNPITRQINVELFVLLFLATNIYFAVLYKKKKVAKNQHLLSYFYITLILLFVFISGGFLSPFAFALYLLSLTFIFIYSRNTAITFTIILLFLFTFSMGEVDVLYNSLVILSLLLMFPLIFFVEKHFQFKQLS